MSGRKITMDAITDGSVTGTGTATHFAVVDEGNAKILHSQALSSSQGVTSGNTFTLTAQAVAFPDPASGAIHDDVLDAACSYISANADKMYILSADPGLTWANIASYALGSKASPSFTGPADN